MKKLIIVLACMFAIQGYSEDINLKPPSAPTEVKKYTEADYIAALCKGRWNIAPPSTGKVGHSDPNDPASKKGIWKDVEYFNYMTFGPLKNKFVHPRAKTEWIGFCVSYSPRYKQGQHGMWNIKDNVVTIEWMVDEYGAPWMTTLTFIDIDHIAVSYIMTKDQPVKKDPAK